MELRTPAGPKIIVAWDGSTASATTFPLARLIAAQLAAEVEILHVLPPGASREDFDRTVREVGLDGLQAAHVRVEAGDVVGTILAASNEPGVALVFLTTHVTSIKSGRHLGSIAEAVIIGTTRPVLLVRPESSFSPREIKRLLLPLDGTPKTATALRPATGLAARLGAALDLLYVDRRDGHEAGERGSVAAPRYVDQPQHEWPDWASEAADRLATCCAECPEDVPVRMFLVHGAIAREIESFAVAHSSDAIVLVRRSRLQVGRARTLRAVLQRAPCPVLIVGGPETESAARQPPTGAS
jgi:nucleotide-binding universal stress UspA family protein